MKCIVIIKPSFVDPIYSDNFKSMPKLSKYKREGIKFNNFEAAKKYLNEKEIIRAIIIEKDGSNISAYERDNRDIEFKNWVFAGRWDTKGNWIGKSSILNLPTDISSYIFRFLNKTDYPNYKLACKSFYLKFWKHASSLPSFKNLRQIENRADRKNLKLPIVPGNLPHSLIQSPSGEYIAGMTVESVEQPSGKYSGFNLSKFVCYGCLWTKDLEPLKVTSQIYGFSKYTLGTPVNENIMLSFTSDSESLIVGEKKIVSIWNIKNKTHKIYPHGKTSEIISCIKAISNKYIVVASDWRLFFYNLEMEKISGIELPHDIIDGLELSQNEKQLLLSVQGAQLIYICDISDLQKPLSKCYKIQYQKLNLQFLADNRIIYIKYPTEEQLSIIVIEDPLKTGKGDSEIKIASKVKRMQLSPDKRYFALLEKDRITIWCSSSLECINTIPREKDALNMFFSEDNSHLSIIYSNKVTAIRFSSGLAKEEIETLQNNNSSSRALMTRTIL